MSRSLSVIVFDLFRQILSHFFLKLRQNRKKWVENVSNVNFLIIPYENSDRPYREYEMLNRFKILPKLQFHVDSARNVFLR